MYSVRLNFNKVENFQQALNLNICNPTGKLLALDALLKERLLHNGSRVVIVARVGRLLNILESFLCNHQLRFLRIDGHAKVRSSVSTESTKEFMSQ